MSENTIHEVNPACAIMTANCPQGNPCRLGINHACIVETEGSDPNLSRYEYECRSCGKQWYVDWPQVQPEFDRYGQIITPPQPVVTELAPSS